MKNEKIETAITYSMALFLQELYTEGRISRETFKAKIAEIKGSVDNALSRAENESERLLRLKRAIDPIYTMDFECVPL